ncbi:MAG: nucleoside-diphosphate kinase [Elusimicrobiota bacterium]
MSEQNKNKLEQTLVLIKPDGLQKSLTGNILTKLSETQLRIVGAKVVRVTDQLAEKHYGHLKDKPFFSELVKYIKGHLHGKGYRRVLALVYRGENAISKVRKLAGATNPEEALPTTVRGAYGRITTQGVYENVIHTSSSPSEAEREIKLWFSPEEIVDDIYPVKTSGDKTEWEES